MNRGESMKFMHIADIHLGAKPNAGEAYSINREREIWDTFIAVIEKCEIEHIDLLLIAGDLFHRQPLLRELKEVDYLFSKLTRTKVVFIVGNHDYLKPDSYYRSYIWSDNVYPLLSENIDCVEIDELELAVYGCSYHRREVPDMQLQEPVRLGKQKYNILLGHGGDDSHMPFRRIAMEQLPYDYIALGHIHKPQILAENKIAYAGALEPVDIADFGTHGYILGITRSKRGMLEGKQTILEFVPFAKREYIALQVEVHPDMTNYELKDYLHDIRYDRGMQHMYQFELIGLRNPELFYDLEQVDTVGNIISIVDNTKPNYNLQKLESENKNNLLGVFIRSFQGVEEGTLEYMALYEGIQAIEETKKG